jgi:hypothetical protein
MLKVIVSGEKRCSNSCVRKSLNFTYSSRQPYLSLQAICVRVLFSRAANGWVGHDCFLYFPGPATVFGDESICLLLCIRGLGANIYGLPAIENNRLRTAHLFILGVDTVSCVSPVPGTLCARSRTTSPTALPHCAFCRPPAPSSSRLNMLLKWLERQCHFMTSPCLRKTKPFFLKDVRI